MACFSTFPFYCVLFKRKLRRIWRHIRLSSVSNTPNHAHFSPPLLHSNIPLRLSPVTVAQRSLRSPNSDRQLCIRVISFSRNRSGWLLSLNLPNQWAIYFSFLSLCVLSCDGLILLSSLLIFDYVWICCVISFIEAVRDLFRLSRFLIRFDVISQSFFPALTKIVGTLGPKSRSVEVISGCLKAGMSGNSDYFTVWDVILLGALSLVIDVSFFLQWLDSISLGVM